jgi:two-component system chemotaxis sensor kinase CheA
MSGGDPVLQVFFEEAEELLRTYEEGVLGLEQAPHDREVLHSIFRAAHTLKGNSSMLGFERIATLTHALEDLLVKLRGGESTPGGDVIDTLLAANDALRDLMARARAGDDSEIPTMAALVEALRAHARSVGREPAAPAPAAPTAAAPAPPPATEVLYEIRFAPPGDLLRRGLDPLRLLDAVATLGRVERVEADPSALPPLEMLDPEACYLAFHCWLRSAAPQAEIDSCFEFVDAPGAVQVSVAEPAPAPASQPAAPSAVLAAAAPAPAPVSTADRLRAAVATDTQSIRVATEKVDRLVDLVGELVITQSMVAQAVHQMATRGFSPERLSELSEAVDQMDRHSRELEERVMAVRMLPIRTVFGRFSRVVRDLAQSEGKLVHFETHGDETELDKTVIERIADPLVHLVRNAVDHGIEAPEERRARGKPETGSLVLSAYQQGGNIYIEVQDDGRGLDRDRILRKAVDVGLVAGADGLTDEQVYALIWEPGFSTAEKVTEVSGRGVGTDVVKRNVTALGGTISIQTVAGRGTTFRVKLPLTLAILEGQSLRVGREVYILPLAAITESVRPTREALRSIFDASETFMMRGQVLPFLRLHRLFSVPEATDDPTRGLMVVVEHDSRRVALLVDELLGQQQFVIKSLDTNFHRVEGVAGATILGDGRVALILDVPGLVALGKAA